MRRDFNEEGVRRARRMIEDAAQKHAHALWSSIEDVILDAADSIKRDRADDDDDYGNWQIFTTMEAIVTLRMLLARFDEVRASVPVQERPVRLRVVA
jgi:hypothetical protein